MFHLLKGWNQDVAPIPRNYGKLDDKLQGPWNYGGVKKSQFTRL